MDQDNSKNVFFMRHGSCLKDGKTYDDMNYEQFMSYLVNRKDPKLASTNSEGTKKVERLLVENVPLKKVRKFFELRKYNIKKLPKHIDIIYYASNRRAKKTAELIFKYLESTVRIDGSLGHYLDEVKFDKKIISKKEFIDKGGMNGCRPIILERWFRGIHSESFEDSLGRIRKLNDLIQKSPYQNILLITHGIIFRLIYLFYNRQIAIDVDGKLSEATLERLKMAPRLKYGGFFEARLNGFSKTSVALTSEKKAFDEETINVAKIKMRKHFITTSTS
jgi:hypothetical protein